MATKTCPVCGSDNSDTAKFCFNCGSIMDSVPAAATARCPVCNEEQETGGKFCAYCGSAMDGMKAAEPVKTEVPEPVKPEVPEPVKIESVEAAAEPNATWAVDGGMDAPVDAPTAFAVGAAASPFAGADASADAGVIPGADAKPKAGSVVSNLNLEAKSEEAKKRVGKLLGTDIDDQLSGRANINLDGIYAANHTEVVEAFRYFNLDLPTNYYVRENIDTNTAPSSMFVSDDDGTIHVMVEGDDDGDKRKVRRSTAVSSDSVYAKQFANSWAIDPVMIEKETVDKSVRKEELERLRHSVEAGDVSTNAAAARVDANRNASVEQQ